MNSRKLFEAWFKKNYTSSLGGDADYFLELEDDEYQEQTTQNMYETWQECYKQFKPEGWKLVPTEPTEEMLEVYRTWQREGLQYMDIGIIKAIIEAAPKEPS